MQKGTSQSIHVIDNSIREQMQLFDRYGDNFFSDTISLIMNFEPYSHKVVFGRPTRTPDHRVILVRRGTMTINVSYNDYTLKEGHLFVIPANSVLIKKAQSDDYNVFCIAFRIPEIDHLGLIDYKESHMALSDSDRRMVENYFPPAGTAHQKPKHQSAKRNPPDNFPALQRLLAVSGICSSCSPGAS